MGSDARDVREHLLVDVEGVDGLSLMATNVKLRVQNLSRQSETGQPILSRVNLDIPAGLIVGIIGPSGSGKSTLLRALNRMWEPSESTVFLDNQDICQLDVLSLLRRVGMLFQLPALFTGTMADNIQYGPRLRGKKLTDIEVQKLLSVADLDPSLASRPASDLSVGQAQRVALARCLANDPEFWGSRATQSYRLIHHKISYWLKAASNQFGHIKNETKLQVFWFLKQTWVAEAFV